MKISSLGLLLLQLLLIAGFIYHFNIEVAFNLPLLFPFVVGVFAVHSLLPSRYRKPVFIIATIIAIAIVLSLKEAFVLLAMAMIGICNIPIGLKWRKLILLAVAAVLVWLRFGHLNHWVTSLMLTILGSMFMFRMLLYLYEQKYEKQAVPLFTQIGYFLMLPNVVFPLFPVVDYKTFQRQYYDAEALQNYQRVILKFNSQKLVFISRCFNKKTSKHFTIGFFVLMSLIFNLATLKTFWNAQMGCSDIQTIFHFTLSAKGSEVQMEGYCDYILENTAKLSTVDLRHF